MPLGSSHGGYCGSRQWTDGYGHVDLIGSALYDLLPSHYYPVTWVPGEDARTGPLWAFGVKYTKSRKFQKIHDSHEMTTASGLSRLRTSEERE